jgi:hypothetical protein
MTAFVKLTRWLWSWRKVPSCETCKNYKHLSVIVGDPLSLCRADSMFYPNVTDQRSRSGNCGPRGKLWEPKVTP